MVLAALNPAYPLVDLFWTMLMVFGLCVLGWAIVVVFRDLFTRTDIGAGRKTLWVLAVLLLPIVGSLAYLIRQSEAMGQRRLQRQGGSDLRMDSYLHTVGGDDQYRSVRDRTRTTQAWSGPIRPA